jgi:hypothetical protein
LSGSAKVTVKALPIVSAPAAAVCVGSTITLSPTAGGTWVSNAPAKATVTDAGLVTGVESGSVIFTFTETVSGCSNTTAAVTVNALPIAVVSSGGTVCADEPLPNVLITLTGKAPWNLTYVKNGTSTSVTNITNSPYTITGAAVGTYTVTALSDDNCTRTSMTGSADVIVKPLPVLTAGTVTHPTTCAGTNGSIAFTTANVPDGNYTLTYTGTGSPKTVAVSANAFTLSGLSAGVYSHFSLTYNNCTGIETTSKSLNDPSAPILSITSAANPTTCGGNEGSIAFTVTNIANGTYALTYTGTGSPKNVAVSAGIFTLNGLVAGTYADFSITSLGCTGTLSVSRTLNAPAAPELTAGTVTHPTTCAGTNGSITFTTANVPDGNYTLTYTGTGSPKTVAVSANAFTLSGLSAGLYSQFSVTRVGCTGNDISIKTLADPNPPTATIAGSIEVCQNAATPDITLAGALGTAPYTFTYRINNGPELTATTVSGSAVTLSQATGAAAGFTYSLVSVQDAKGCSQSQNGSAVITVNLLPVLTFTGPNPVCQGQPSTLATASAGTWMANAPSVATIGSDGTITTLEAGNATFMFTASGTGCPATSGQLIVKPTPTSALTASKTDVCPNTQVTLDARCSIPTATVNWSPGGPTVIPAAAILPYVYKASCTADGCTGNETSVEIRTQRILVDMKDLGAGVLPRAVIGSVIDNMAPVNQINAPPNNRRWTFIANGCEASEAVVFKLSGPVNFSTIDNAGVYAMFANDEGGFYSLDHPNYGNGGSFSNGTYTLTVDLRTGDGVGGPFPKNRVATGGLLATRTLQFTVGSPQSIVGSRQVATDLENGFSVEVAPNPVSNTLHLKVNEAQGQQVDVNLVDAAGRQLLQRTFVPGTDRHQEEFELNEITSGMYFLKVKAGQKQTTLKVIKYK